MMMEHPQQPREQGGRTGGSESETKRRGMGVIRRRAYHKKPSGFEHNDGFGERNSWNDKDDEEEGRFFGTARRGHGRSRSSSRMCSRKEGDKGSSRRPALIFLAQAALSFVGMVVLPTQLAYEVLVRSTPSGGGNHLGAGAPPASFSLDVRAKSSWEIAAAARGLSPKAGEGGGEGRGGRRYLSDDGVVLVDGKNTAVAGDGEVAGVQNARVLQTAEENGDSFTYSTRTQFDLCSETDSELTEDALRAAIMDVFEVQQSQIEGSEGTVEQRESSEFCGDNRNEWTVAIRNTPTADKSAAVISGEQLELVRSPVFLDTLATSINNDADFAGSVTPEEFSYGSLGYIILYDEDQAETTAVSGGLSNDFVGFTGPDQWWPWWAWLLFGLGLLFCICPLAACIYRYKAGPPGPPSPSGAGGGPGMFGKRGNKSGMGGSDVDWEAEQFQKGGGVTYGDKDEGPFNDAATGISTDSPRENLNASTMHTRDAAVIEPATSGEVGSGEWPDALESGVGVAGPTYTSRYGSSAMKLHEGDEVASLSEADRAAGVDPSRQLERDTSVASSKPLMTSASFNPTAANVSPSRQSMPGAADSSGAIVSSFQDRAFQGSAGGSDAPQLVGGGPAALSRGLGAGAAALGAGHLTSGPSGRSLGEAAAALGEESDEDHVFISPESSPVEKADSSSSSGGMQSRGALSYRTGKDDGTPGGGSLDGKVAAWAEAEDDTGLSTAMVPGSGGGGSSSMGGPAIAAAAAAGIPPSGRSSRDSSRHTMEGSGAGETRASAGLSVAPSGQRSRSDSGSTMLEEIRQMTDDERQQVMQESEGARAASVLRGTTFKTPLQPDLERAITEEEQERRRVAVQAVEASRASGAASDASDGEGPAAPVGGAASAAAAASGAAGGEGDEAGRVESSPAGMTPPSTTTSLIGKVGSFATNLGMGRFFGMDAASAAADSSTAAPASAAGAGAAEAEPITEEDFKAGPAEGAVGAAGGVLVPEAAGEVDADDVVPRAGVGSTAGAVPTIPEVEATSSPEVGAAAATGAAAAGIAAVGAAGAAGRSPRTDEAEAEAEATAAASIEGKAPRGGVLSPEEKQAYSDNVDRTLEELPEIDEGGVSLPVSEILAVPPSGTADAADAMPDMGASAAVPSAAPPAGATGSRALGLPPSGPGQAAALAMQQHQPATGSQTPALDMSRVHYAEGSGMDLEELDSNVVSPIVATPPALLRPGVGAAARGAAARGRGLLQRNNVSGSFVSSRSTSVTEDMMSNNLTEDDMSSDAQNTDVSRTSSYIATGSSFEESLAQSQAASGRFLSSGNSALGGPAAPPAAAPIPAPGDGDGNPSSLAECLARAEETVGREHEKGLLYRQGPEGVAAAVAGEELPLPPAAAAAMPMGGAAAAAAGGGSSGARASGPADSGVGRVESLADILARADDGPGNLKETFKMLDDLDDRKSKRLQELTAAASADDADDETKARWRGSLAELFVKVDRAGNVLEFIDSPVQVSESSSASDGHAGALVSSESDSAAGSARQRQAGPHDPQARPE